MAATLNATSRLGAFVAAMAGAELAPDVAVKAAICLLDPLGLAPAAREEPTAMAARSMTMRVPSGSRAARVWADEAYVPLPGEAGRISAEVLASACSGGSRPVRMLLDRIIGSHGENEK